MSILEEPGMDPAEEQALEQQLRSEAPVKEPEPVKAEVKEEPVVAEKEEEPQPVPTVPLQALNEARHANRQLKSELAQVKEQLQSLSQLREELEQFRNRTKSQVDQDTFTKDPLGTLRQDIQSLKQTQEEAVRKQSLEAEERQRMQVLEQTVASRVQEFSKTTPDYTEALQHLLQSRAQELQMLGVPQEQIDVAISTESTQLAMNALNSGMNPAEVVYQLAKMRGYTPKQAQAMKKEAEKIVSIEKGQKAASTLATAPGGTDEVSLGDIEKMSDEEFDKYWDEKVAGKRR